MTSEAGERVGDVLTSVAAAVLDTELSVWAQDVMDS